MKVLYDFSSNYINVFGFRKRNHIILNAIVCIGLMGILMNYGTDLGKFAMTLCIFVSQINVAYCDTVTDALSF